MPLQPIAKIGIPGSTGSSFDHGAFDSKTRRVFVAHTGRNCLEVIDRDSDKHLRSLPGFPEAAGVVADQGMVLVTNRGSASLALVDAETLDIRRVFKVGSRPNGVAIVPQRKLAIAACIGDEGEMPTLHVIELEGEGHYSIELPGRPRWCVTNAVGDRVFLAVQEPSLVFTARLPQLDDVKHWALPSVGAHGLDIDHQRARLYCACDDAVLVEVDACSGAVIDQWPLAGAPDVTFFNPATGSVHVAIGQPGLIQSVDPRTGAHTKISTGLGTHTTALVAPNRLYAFSPSDGGALVLADT